MMRSGYGGAGHDTANLERRVAWLASSTRSASSSDPLLARHPDRADTLLVACTAIAARLRRT
jgi:hypothetical protein